MQNENRNIRPDRPPLTPEERAQIVDRVEARFRSAIVEPEHSTGCRCMRCFNAQLDRIVDGTGITWEGISDE